MRLGMSNSLKQHLNGRSVQVEVKKVEQKKPIDEGFLNQPEKPPAIDNASDNLKRLKQERFMDRHRRLMNSLDKQPFDVRWLASAVNKVGKLQVMLVHLYADTRSFLAAHRGGYCSLVDATIREVKCATCEWAYFHEKHRYCKGCPCPNWPASRLTHKVKLAKFVCPKGHFGRARGWIARILNYYFTPEVK